MECEEEGRPAYHPSILLKLYLYGYHHGIRTSRKLEREAKTNLEAMWLLTGLRSKYKTIADPRSVILHKNIINVGYNIQASSDSKHKLLVEYDTGSVNDTHALSDMALATKGLLGVEQLNVLADKGYHTGEELARCAENGITTFVSPKAPATKETGLFPISSFMYEPEKDHYICPAGQTMITNGTWHRHSDGRNKRSAYRFRRFTNPSCKGCTLRNQCTKGRNGRYIDRSEYADIVEENAQRVQNSPDYYRKRQQITEHPFGTLKRQRGFTHTLVRKKDPVLGEVGLMFMGYNLGRCVNIFGFNELIKLLKNRCLHPLLLIKRLILRHYEAFYFFVGECIPEKSTHEIRRYLIPGSK